MHPLLEANQKPLAELCRRYGVARLELFGSAAEGTFDPDRSDLDFLVEFADLPPGRRFDSFMDLKFTLEKLFGRPVDLIVASAVTNPYMQQSISRTRQLLYAA